MVFFLFNLLAIGSITAQFIPEIPNFPPIAPITKEHTWIFQMMEIAQWYDKNELNMNKLDSYYDNCMQKKDLTLNNCEICMQYSLYKWNYFVDSLFNKTYQSNHGKPKYQKLLLEMKNNWIELQSDIKRQRKVLFSKISVTPKNYILLYYEEIYMLQTYSSFLRHYLLDRE